MGGHGTGSFLATGRRQAIHYDCSLPDTQPKWLRENYGASDILLGLHKLILFEYDYVRLRSFIEKYLMHCSGETWDEVAQKVRLLGYWEFEGYDSHAR